MRRPKDWDKLRHRLPRLFLCVNQSLLSAYVGSAVGRFLSYEIKKNNVFALDVFYHGNSVCLLW